MQHHSRLSFNPTHPRRSPLAVAMRNLAGLAVLTIPGGLLQADIVTDAISGGKATLNFDLRYEHVEQDNALKDATALQLRSLVGYRTGEVNGFSAMVELEDTRNIAGVDDYASPPTGYNTGEFSVIPDPEHTELDQAYVQYKNDLVTVRLGRQVITHDGHRFIGHVGWRHDRLTFDAATVIYKPLKDLELSYSHIGQRNGIFAEAADADTSDDLLRVSWTTPHGVLSLYDYDLERDDVEGDGLNTSGVRFSGSKKTEQMKWLYSAEFASQDSQSAAADYDAEYRALELGVGVSGHTLKIGQELLGSDGGEYGFATPLATLHKFNGWADQFIGTPTIGLEDTYASYSTAVLGGKFGVTWHDYQSDEKDGADQDDLGEELNLVFKRKFAKHYSVGIKYADYRSGAAASGKVDTEKLWVWFGAKFD